MKLINNNRLVYTIVAVFTVIQFAIILVFGPTLYYDSDCYIYFAKDCVAHGEPYPVASEIGSYDFIWNVGSINIVALSLFLFHAVTPLYFIYAILKGLSALLLYKITCPKTTGPGANWSQLGGNPMKSCMVPGATEVFGGSASHEGYTSGSIY